MLLRPSVIDRPLVSVRAESSTVDLSISLEQLSSLANIAAAFSAAFPDPLLVKSGATGSRSGLLSVMIRRSIQGKSVESPLGLCWAHLGPGTLVLEPNEPGSTGPPVS